MKGSFLYSLLAHLIIIILLFVSIPSWHKEQQINESAVLWVDLNKVEISNKTNLPPKKQERRATKNVVKKEVKNVAEPVKEKKYVEPVQKEVKQEDAVPVVEKKVKQEVQKKPKPAEVKKKPKAKPDVKPTTKPKKTDDEDDLDSLFSSVEKISKSDEMKKSKAKNELSNMMDGVLDGFADTKGFDKNSKISVNEIDFIAAAVRRNWRRDAGVEGIETMIVVLEVNLMPDGQVSSVKIVEDVNRMKTDKAYASVAESARRAVSICDKLQESPFKQLAQKYPASYRDWQKLRLRFNPMDS